MQQLYEGQLIFQKFNRSSIYPKGCRLISIRIPFPQKDRQYISLGYLCNPRILLKCWLTGLVDKVAGSSGFACWCRVNRVYTMYIFHLFRMAYVPLDNPILCVFIQLSNNLLIIIYTLFIFRHKRYDKKKVICYSNIFISLNIQTFAK